MEESTSLETEIRTSRKCIRGLTIRAVLDRIKDIDKFLEQHELYIIWVQGHRRFEGNTRADTLSKRCMCLGIAYMENKKKLFVRRRVN